MKKIGIILFCILLSFEIKSQLATELSQAPVIVPSSPTAASLALFVDYPISHYTGIPNISIPVYNINIDNFTMPIT